MFTKSKCISKKTSKIDIGTNWKLAVSQCKTQQKEFQINNRKLIKRFVNQINQRFVEATNCICPYCKGKLHKKKDTKVGFHKYRCSKCSHNFTTTIGTPFYHTKLKVWQILSILAGMCLQSSERLSTMCSGTTLTTTHNRRHGLMELFPTPESRKAISREVVMDEIYFRKRGKNVFTNKEHKRGLSLEQSCVYSCCSPHASHINLFLIGYGKPNIERSTSALDVMLDKSKVKVLQTDGDKTYGYFCNCNNIKCNSVKGNPALKYINSIHAKLRNFLSRFWGIRTYNLQLFLNWFCFIFNWTYVGYKEKMNRITNLILSKSIVW